VKSQIELENINSSEMIKMNLKIKWSKLDRRRKTKKSSSGRRP